MNIAIIGTGGVGGYFGGRIAKAGYKVTCVARGAHYNAIKLNGLEVKSINGNFKVKPEVVKSISELINVDLVILGVKSWQLKEVAIALKPVINSQSIILPLQNGVNNAEILYEVVPPQNVLAGLCKIVSKIEVPGVINHFAIEPEIIFGEIDNVVKTRTEAIKTIFDKSNIKSKISSDIHLDVWRKFLFITTVSGMAALTRSSFGALQKDPAIVALLQQTAEEIMLVAQAKGINITELDIENIMAVFNSMDAQTTASMQRDIMQGKPSELHTFNGYIVNQANILGLKVPINHIIFHSLKFQERQAREAK